MELIVITLFFIISLSLIFQAPCASSLHIQVQSSHEKGKHACTSIEVQLSDLPTLPRKLRVTAEVTVKQHGGPETMSRNNQKSEPVQAGNHLLNYSLITIAQPFNGRVFFLKILNVICVGKKTYNKEKGEMHGGKGTRQEWVEGTDTSQYFTMDYSHVKRRRPIHNKSLPVGP
ncbi:hypothetical protein Pint_23444 [Pistacia integerrima]|uniref:Uncharacterized protein n=1 Tax=Pistacia integerrima TaxID=434235 RepID=A0ACC0YIJ3_9ROSI|nr:hypothetical protein Pint_23444 [Pistacia integerrima]